LFITSYADIFPHRKRIHFIPLFYQMCRLYFTVPTSAPVNVRGHNISSTSILVEWGSVPAAKRNGVIKSYTVSYKALPDGIPKRQVASGATNQATLTSLKKYTNYSITVFASTAKGNGNASEPIIGITDQDSRFHFCCRCCWEQKILRLMMGSNLGLVYTVSVLMIGIIHVVKAKDKYSVIIGYG